MEPELQSAVANAVDLVNTHSGQACVTLQFADDPEAIDFVASSARLHGRSFEFSSGFETYTGSLDELSTIRAELIRH